MTGALVHMDGTRLMGRWDDLTGKPHELSTREYILQYGQEFRGSLGHIGLIGISRYVLPLIAGTPNTAFAQPSLDDPYIDGARAQGGAAGFMHPYLRGGDTPEAWAGSLIPVDVARGEGDFYDVATLYSDELTSAEMYYRLLNCGFRLPATTGSDNFSDVFLDPPPGADRTYVRVRGRLTFDAWLAGLKAGRTFGTTGPLIFLEVEGREPGDEIALEAGASPELRVQARVVSITPVDRLEILVNGQVAASVSGGEDRFRVEYSGRVSLPAGGWIAARAVGPGSRYVSDSYAFAQTSPVYVVRDGRPYVSAEDAGFLAQVVDAIWGRVIDGPWRTAAERDAFKRAIDEARAVYERLARDASR